jgi:hypothetical protein
LSNSSLQITLQFKVDVFNFPQARYPSGQHLANLAGTSNVKDCGKSSCALLLRKSRLIILNEHLRPARFALSTMPYEQVVCIPSKVHNLYSPLRCVFVGLCDMTFLPPLSPPTIKRVHNTAHCRLGDWAFASKMTWCYGT